MLYSAEIILAVVYFCARVGATSGYKYWVCGMLAIDTTCTVAICAQTLLAFIPTGTQSWPAPVIAIATSLSAFWEQGFLYHRFWRFSRICNWIFIILMPVTLTQVLFAIISAAGIMMDLNTRVILVSFILRAGTDAIIAATLVWRLAPYSSRRNILQRIALISIASGICSSLISIISLVFQIKSLSVFTSFFSFQGRVYSLTIIANLLTPYEFSFSFSANEKGKNKVMRYSGPLIEAGVFFVPQMRSQVDLPDAHLPTVARYDEEFTKPRRMRDDETIASGFSIVLPEPEEEPGPSPSVIGVAS